MAVLIFLAASLARAQSTLPAKADEVKKPVAAFFPLGGDAPQTLRDKVGFSLRSKLDRDGTYEVVDGPRMSDLSAMAGGPITATTDAEVIRELAENVDATVLAWGELNNHPDGPILKLNLWDLRAGQPKIERIEHPIATATDLRFVSEQVLERLPGVKPFEHPSEVAVVDDAESQHKWQHGKNLVVNGTFDREGDWEGIYRDEQYEVPRSRELPPPDRMVMYRSVEEDGVTHDVLAMNLSKEAAETNGLACLSSPIPIEPDRRYRLSFRYRSDGPRLHVFVKGYMEDKDLNGKPTLREIYRRQVPPSGATKGKWVTITDDLNPQQATFPVQYVKVDLYAYLHPGLVFFDDVILKEVGKPTRHARDAAIDAPVTRPAGGDEGHK